MNVPPARMAVVQEVGPSTRASAWAPQVQAEALLTALADDCLGLCVMEAGARPLVMLASTCRGARSLLLPRLHGMRARALLALSV